MTDSDRWLLPDGIDEVLPPEALQLEIARRQLLDGFQTWGYELLITPMVEFLESLLTGTGSDLDLKTFKVTDQVSGRTLGIRADMTPQVARTDAHSLRRDGESRLCYAGTVLHAKADNMLASRAPISVGAELFGESSAAGDLEIVSLMLDSISRVSNQPLHLELGDVGIYRALVADSGLSTSQQQVLFDQIQGKAIPDLQQLVTELALDPVLSEQLLTLPTLCGDERVLEQGKQQFEQFPEIIQRIENLQWIADQVQQRFNDVHLNYDLSELRGYNYHTGIVFATYLKNSGIRVAKGGRYDDVGLVFGRARGATGFDIDLKSLVRNSAIASPAPTVIEAPGPDNGSASDADAWWQLVQDLRAKGNIVIESSVDSAQQRIEWRDGQWQVVNK